MAKKKTEQKKSTVYIGHPLQGLPQYSVFINGVLPAHVEQKAKANDCVAGLIVPLDELAQARKDVLKHGTLLNFYMTHLMDKEH